MAFEEVERQTRRSWTPLAAALALVVILIGAVVWNGLRRESITAAAQFAITQCKTAFYSQNESTGPKAIANGNVFRVSEWESYRSYRQHHKLALAELEAPASEITEAWANTIFDDHNGEFWVVWRFADSTHGECAVVVSEQNIASLRISELSPAE